VQMETKLVIKEDWTQIQQQLRRTWRKGMLHNPRSQSQVQRHNRVQMETKLVIKEDWT